MKRMILTGMLTAALVATMAPSALAQRGPGGGSGGRGGGGGGGFHGGGGSGGFHGGSGFQSGGPRGMGTTRSASPGGGWQGGGGWHGGSGHGGGSGGGWHGGGSGNWHGSNGWHGGGGNWHGGGYDHHGWHGHGGAEVYFGVSPWGWGTWPYWSYPYYYDYYAPPPVYVYPPYQVAPEEDQVWVERPSEGTAGGDRPAGYWYYCESRRGYYPKVPTCPEQWVKVPPRGDDR